MQFTTGIPYYACDFILRLQILKCCVNTCFQRITISHILLMSPAFSVVPGPHIVLKQAKTFDNV